MTKYEKVQQILANAAGPLLPNHDGHGRFWEVPLGDFVNLTIYGQQLIAAPGPNRGQNSALVKALKGEDPFDGSPFGRMPLGQAPVAPADIAFIEQWIDDGMPNDEVADEPTDTHDDTPTDDDTVEPEPCQCGHAVYNANCVRDDMGTIKLRKNIIALTPEELQNYRTAIQMLKDLPGGDPSNYEVQAAIHGAACRHNNELFLTWHRAYLYRFELLLQDQVPGVTIPYWDFSTTQEVPDAFTQQTLPNGDPNPLYNPTRTPGPGAALPSPATITSVLGAPDFDTFGGGPSSSPFSGDLESNAHNTVHTWIGGDASDVPTAGFDPLFWSLHCNVDRLWREWQRTHSDGPADLMQVLEPFNMTAGETLSVTDLGYDYGSSEAMVILDPTRGCGNFESDDVYVPEHADSCGYETASLYLHNIIPPALSYHVHVYIEDPKADHRTKTDGNPNYAGRFSTFGHGGHGQEGRHGERNQYHGSGQSQEGHSRRRSSASHHQSEPCSPAAYNKYDYRLDPHDRPYTVRMDVTDCMKRCGYGGDKHQDARQYKTKGDVQRKPLNIKLVCVDGRGRPLPNEVLKCEAISVVFRD